MELKTHETGSGTYPGHGVARQSSGSERRRDLLPHNDAPGLSANTSSHQTLDPKHQRLDPNPDPVSYAFSIPSPNPISAGSKPKSGNPQPVSTVRYGECLRNHAASIGGNVYDGCGEFMPSGDDGTLEALKCAACQCHRNFHRKEISGERNFSPNLRRNLSSPPPLPLPSPTPIHHHPHHRGIIQPVNVVFSGGGGGGGNESSSEDLNPFGSGEIVPSSSAFSFSKKRFRTKFTTEQKEKMMEFAEKLGWRISKQNDEEVDRFCSEAGVKRQVFKVWMHNNKNTAAKGKQPPLLTEEGSGGPAHQHEQQVQWPLNNENDEEDDDEDR